MKFARVALLLALTAAPSLAVVKNQPPGSGGGGGGSGTVTQVSATAVAPLCVSGSPITISGTLTFTWCTGALGSQYGGTGEQGTITGLLRGNGTSPFTAAGYSDVVGLFSGTPSSTCYLSGSGACSVPPGGAIPSTTDVLIGNGSGGAADSGIGLLSLNSLSSLYFGYPLPSASAAGQDNTTFGFGAGASLATSGVTQSQNDVLIGFGAGTVCTTCRETVAIGAFALYSYTGNGNGPDDGTMVAIGAEAANDATAAGGSGSSVIVGQKAGAYATTLASTVMIGSHVGSADGSSSQDVMIGASVINSTNAPNLTTSNNMFLGAQVAANNPTGTITNNVAIGAYAGYDLANGAASNVLVGFDAGNGCTSCLYNVAIGSQAGQFLGSAQNNTFVGQQAGYYNTSSGNSLFGFFAGNALTTGSLDSFGEYACGGISTGVNSVCFGQSAGRNAASAVSYAVFLGYGAGYSAQGNGNVEIGYEAALYGNGGSNTDVGYKAGYARTSGSNNLAIGYDVASSTCTTGNNNIMFGTSAAVDCLTSSTSNEINIGGLLFYNNASTAAPTVSACGTSSIDSHANDKSGTVTTGTATSCTITFASAYTTWNHCRVTSQSALTAFAYSYTLSAITVTATALAGGKIDYDCDGV